MTEITDVVVTYHIYPEGCCDEYRYVLTNELPDLGIKGVSIIYQERSSETQKYEAKDTISLDLKEAAVIHKLIGKLLTGEA